MKLAIFVLALAAIVTADKLTGNEQVPIIRNDLNIDAATGGFQYSYETGNGITAQKSGTLKSGGTEGQFSAITGSYAYTSPEGKAVSLQYTADENGYIATGDDVPVGPEVPVLIQKALAYLAAHPPKPEK